MSQAPGHGLEALFAVANSRHGRDAHAHIEPGLALAPGERHDHLENHATAREFLRAQGVRLPAGDPSPAELRAMRVLRDGVHRLVRGSGPASRRLVRLLARHRYRLDPSGRFRPDDSGWPGFIAELLVALTEAGLFGDRLKRCANPDCGWVFVDVSKNRSRQWCEVRTCGNRANLRRYRERIRQRRRASRARG